MGRILNINYIDYSPATKSLDLFVAGCNQPYCKDCCNPELLDFQNGQEWHAWKDNIEKYHQKRLEWQEYKRRFKENGNIEIYYNANVEKIYGDNKIERIDINQNDDKISLDIDGLFLAIGKKPNNQLYKDQIKLNDYGYNANTEVYIRKENISYYGIA